MQKFLLRKSKKPSLLAGGIVTPKEVITGVYVNYADSAGGIKGNDIPLPAPSAKPLIPTPNTPSNKVRFTISCNVPTAHVIINGVEISTVSVEKGTEVSWRVYADRYKEQSGSLTVEEDTVKEVTLVEIDGAYLTIVPSLENAVVTINGVETKKAFVEKDTNVDYSVSAENYETVSASTKITEDTTLNVILYWPATNALTNGYNIDTEKWSIENSSTSSVNLTSWYCSGTVGKRKDAKITPKKDFYATYMTIENYYFSTSYYGAGVVSLKNASYKTNSNGKSYDSNDTFPISSHTGDYKNRCGFSFSEPQKLNYVNLSAYRYASGESGFVAVYSLKGYWANVLTINSNVEATITIDGVSTVGTTATKSVTYNGYDNLKEVEYTVFAENYISQSGKVLVNEDTIIDVNLVREEVTVTIHPTPEDAKVLINGVETNSAVVGKGITVTYEVSKTGYGTVSGEVVANDNIELDISLQQAYKVTFKVNPDSATIITNGEEL